MAKNGQLRMLGVSWTFSMSRTIKSAGKMNPSTFTENFSIIPIGYLIDQSTHYKETIVGFSSPKPNFVYIKKGIKLILTPKS